MSESGVPTRETLEAFGLSDVASDLRRWKATSE